VCSVWLDGLYKCDLVLLTIPVVSKIICSKYAVCCRDRRAGNGTFVPNTELHSAVLISESA
jgi:hypothetical protein